MSFFVLFSPYYAIALSGTYSLLQNFQAMGWAQMSIFPGGLGVFEAVRMISGAYLLLLPLVFLLNIVAASVLSKRLAWVLGLVWLSPCVLKMFGIQWFHAVVPEKYVIGSGGADQLGSATGALINAFVMVVIAWSISTLLLHLMRAGKRSKSAFDHLWYLLGLTAIVFYVSDNGFSSEVEHLAETNRDLSRAFTLLNGQIEREYSNCWSSGLKETQPLLCGWLGRARDYLDRASENNWVGRKYSTAPNSDELFSLSARDGADSRAVVQAIREYNDQVCSERRNANPACQTVPIELNLHPLMLDGRVSPYATYAISAEAVMPTINRKWGNSIKEQDQVNAQKSLKNKRWAYLTFLFSFLIGIKVSHASRELFGGSELPLIRSFFRRLNRRVWTLLVVVLLALMLSLLALVGFLAFGHPFNRQAAGVER